jgi:TolA-binding protein
MKKSLVFAVAMLSVAFLSGCLMTREQIREGATSPGGSKSEISQMQVKRAEEVARMDELEESVRLLRGEVEVAQNQIRQMEAANKAASKVDGNQPMSQKEVLQKLAIFEEALRSMEAKVNSMGQELQALKSRPKSAATSSAKPKEDTVGNYGGAQQSFDRKDWKKAIVGYEKYRELNPKGRRYADATYKIGVCFQELGMKSEAKSFYQEVIAKFPKSNTAKKAKYRLSQVK